MDIRRATETSLEGTLEKAVAWGLPVAPLLTSMLFTLATTPARRAVESPPPFI